MTWFDRILIVLWCVLGSRAWIKNFRPYFRWWFLSGLVDWMLTGVFFLITYALSLILGPLSYLLWSQTDPRNYR